MSQGTVRPLNVGLHYQFFEGTMTGHTPRWNDLQAIVRHAEAVGFHLISIPDHLIFDVGETDKPPVGIWECWSVLAALAAVTTRIQLATEVVCTSFRNPALLAKMADTVDEISGGRLILGLGAGYHQLEFRAFGYPFDHLIGRFEEALQIIHSLLRTGQVDFQGQYYQARDCELRPRGPTAGGPPIMIGARPDRPRALRLAAQYADYWNMLPVNRVEDVAPLRAAVDAACAKAGRDPTTLKRTITALVDMPGSETDPAVGGFARWRAHRVPATGTPEQLASLLRGFAHEGVDHVQISLEPPTMAGIDAFAPVLELLDKV